MDQINKQVNKLKKRLAFYQKYHLKSLAKNISKRIEHYQSEIEKTNKEFESKMLMYEAEETQRRKQQEELIRMNKLKDFTLYGIRTIGNTKYDNQFYEPHEKPVIGDVELLSGNEFYDTARDIRAWFGKLPQNIKLWFVQFIAIVQTINSKLKQHLLKFTNWLNQNIAAPVKTWSSKVKSKIKPIQENQIPSEEENESQIKPLSMMDDDFLMDIINIPELKDSFENIDKIVDKYVQPVQPSKMNEFLNSHNVDLSEIKHLYEDIKVKRPGEPSGLPPSKQLEKNDIWEYSPSSRPFYPNFTMPKEDEDVTLFKKFIPAPDAQPSDNLSGLEKAKEEVKKKIKGDVFSLKNMMKNFNNNNPGNNNLLFE